MLETIHFLSKESLIRHNEYLKRLRLEYAILEKSYPVLHGKSSCEIMHLDLARGLRVEAYASRLEIELHELFFSSFSEANQSAKLCFRNNISRAGFLYDAENSAIDTKGVFLIIFKSRNGCIDYKIITSYCDVLTENAMLALDLCAHSYYQDYGFDKRRYLRAALSCINLNKII